LIFFSILTFLVLIIFFFTKTFFLNDYLKIEKVNNEKKIHNFIHLIEKTFDKLTYITIDYARWDQSYKFIEDKNEEFIYDNFRASSDTLENLDLNFIIFSSLDNKTVYSSYNSKLFLDNKSFEEYLYMNFNEGNINGFVKFEDKVLFITKMGISNSDFTKNINGFLYTGKILNEQYLRSLDVNFKEIEILDSVVRNGLSNLDTKIFDSALKVSVNQENNTLYNLLNIYDIRKNVVTTLEIQSDMQFLKRSRSTVLIFSLIITILILIIFLLLYNQNKKLKSKIKEKTKELERTVSALSKKNKTILKTTQMFNNSQQIAHIGSYDYNIKTSEVLWSDEHYRIIGKDPKSFDPVVDDYFEVVHPDDRVYVESMLEKTILNDKVYRFKYRIILKDGTLKYVQSTSGISKKDENGEPLIMSGTIFDITEIIRKEEELKSKEALLIEQSKMAAMGEMIGNIAHQMKQPLNLISTIASSIKLDKAFGELKEDSIEKSMDEITASTKHLSSTIDDFRDFFKPDKMLVETNIKDVFQRAYKLTNAQFNIGSITVVEEIENGLIKVFDNELLQVILNIFNNARDELIKKDINFKRYLFINAYFQRDQLYITIKDNAGGIKEDILNKVFDAYFTTKRDDKGTGIGLYMSKQIIENNLKGSINVANEEFIYEDENYKGASFIIKLPINH